MPGNILIDLNSRLQWGGGCQYLHHIYVYELIFAMTILKALSKIFRNFRSSSETSIANQPSKLSLKLQGENIDGVTTLG